MSWKNCSYCDFKGKLVCTTKGEMQKLTSRTALERHAAPTDLGIAGEDKTLRVVMATDQPSRRDH